MKKIILSLILITSTVFSCDWIDCKNIPVPENEVCLFYEAKTKKILVSKPEDFRISFNFIFNQHCEITHWMPFPDTPSI